MKKLSTVVFAMLLTGALAFAQTGGGSTAKPGETSASATSGATTGKKTNKTKKGHKGGKKMKKASAAKTTQPAK